MQQIEPKPEAQLDQTADSATLRLCQRVRELRNARGWTLEQLAKVSGVSRSMLSQIERQQVNPTFHVAYRVAQAFGMSLGQLVDDDDQPLIEVIRSHDEHYRFREDEDHSVRSLYPMHLEKDIEFYELKLRAGGRLPSSAHLAGTREFLTVQKGRIRVCSGHDEAILEAGDSARYPADIDHVIENVGRGDALAFLVAIYRPAKQ